MNAVMAVEQRQIGLFACRDGSFVDSSVLEQLFKEVMEGEKVQMIRDNITRHRRSAKAAVKEAGSSAPSTYFYSTLTASQRAESMAEEQRPHLVALPFPAAGHINPLLLLCCRLVSMGCTVTFVNVQSTQQRLFGSTGAVKAGPHLRFVSFPDDDIPFDKLGNNLQWFLQMLEQSMRSRFKELLLDPSLPPVSCLLCDAFIYWTQEIGRDLGIPRASLWTSSASWGLVNLHLDVFKEKGLLPVPESCMDQVVDFIPGLPPVLFGDLASTFHKEDSSDPGFQERMCRNMALKQDDWLLMNSFSELEPAVFDKLRAVNSRTLAVGPLLPPDVEEDREYLAALVGSQAGPWKEELSCLEWLDKQEVCSVLYISFGSLASVSVEQMKEIAIGLERSCVHFLWVIRLDLQDKRNEVVEMVKQNERGMVIAWAPQLKVLKHPAVAVFLSHCGWNSLSESIACGVPVLGWPCFAEQKVNAVMAVEHWQVGLFACRDGSFVDGSVLEQLFKEVMEGEKGQQIRANSARLGRSARSAVKEGGSSDNDLKTFYEDLKSAASVKWT